MKGKRLMKFSRLTKPELEKILQNANFTKDEEEIFKDLSRGISEKEISLRHFISVSTVERRTRRIKEKIKRLNRSEK